jgi:hypothetical protein
MSIDVFALLSACTPLSLVVHQPSAHHVQIRRDDGSIVAEWWPSKGTTMAGGVRGPKCTSETAFIKMFAPYDDDPQGRSTSLAASRSPTDDEVFSAICADFPFDSAQLEALHRRLDELLGRAQNGRASGGDGTIGKDSWNRLRVLTWAMRDLITAMRIVESDGDPDDDIPF